MGVTSISTRLARVFFKATLTLCCGVSGLFAQSYSAPKGFYRLDLTVGYQTVGVSIVNQSLLNATIASSSGATITLGENFDVSAILEADLAYYVEIINGPSGTGDPQVGQRFEVDTTATVTPGQIGIDLGAAHNTDSVLPQLADHTLTLRPHVALNQIFDKAKLHASTSFDNADQVQVFSGGGFSIYYLYGSSGLSQWVPFGSFENSDNMSLLPGQGLLFKRSALSSGAISLNVLGVARTNPFVQPLVAGMNFLAEGYPVSLSFEQRHAYGAGFEHGDRTKVFNGSGFETYLLYSQGDVLDDNLWTLLGDPLLESQNTSKIFDYSGAVFFELVGADPNYRIESPIAD
ncbi:MAG: hypothetical protein ACI8T1_001071 [Verrucomicrobiales bacterium]|jgi:hypothetical protein